jgi:Gpi18-like mannosyltransferase
VFLFNPAFWYNTIIWGQVDSIHTFFVFVSVLFAINKKPLPALVFMLLAVNTKGAGCGVFACYFVACFYH